MCIILFKKIDNNNYIAKNRDQSSIINISIIHEIVDNVEIVYFYDLDSMWIEGMNEFGIGFVSSSLNDRNEITDKRKQDLYTTKKKMLTYNNIENIINEWILLSKKSDLNENSYDGHSLICDSINCIHIETYQNQNPSKENIINDSVFTNHGIKLKESGYTTGINYMSSLLRKELCYNELKNVKNKMEILSSINKNYINLNPYCHTYRNKKQTIEYYDNPNLYKSMSTTSQILLCLNELIFVLKYDKEYSNFIKYDYRLPKNYVPKIKVIINSTTKSNNYNQMPFDHTYINRITEKYMYKKNTILFYCIILIFILIIYISIYNNL